jgi:glycosyltransferase involved in cell wall biosynthesis
MCAEFISVVIPVYNSEASLTLLVQKLEPVLKEFRSAEVALVNDGSRDGSWAIVEELACWFDFVRGIDLMRNYACGSDQSRNR